MFCWRKIDRSLNSPMLLFHLCCKNKRQVFLSVYMYVDCLNNDYSAGDDNVLHLPAYLSCYMNTV